MNQHLTERPCELCGWMQTEDGTCSNPTCDHYVVPDEVDPGSDTVADLGADPGADVGP